MGAWMRTATAWLVSWFSSGSLAVLAVAPVGLPFLVSFVGFWEVARDTWGAGNKRQSLAEVATSTLLLEGGVGAGVGGNAGRSTQLCALRHAPAATCTSEKIPRILSLCKGGRG